MGQQTARRPAMVFEDDRIVHVGPRYTGGADARIDAAGRLVSPGFINTHVHTIFDVGGLRGDWDDYARLVDDLGVRVYGSPAFGRHPNGGRRAPRCE